MLFDDLVWVILFEFIVIVFVVFSYYLDIVLYLLLLIC